MSKANKTKLSRNDTDYDRYIAKTKNCGIATASLIGAHIAGAITGNAIMRTSSRSTSSQQIPTDEEDARASRKNSTQYYILNP